MSVYHVFLTYRDVWGEEWQLLQYDISSITDLCEQFIDPIQADRVFKVQSYAIIPSNILRLYIYRSDCLYAEIRLPGEHNPLDESHEYVQRLFESGLIEGVEPCTSQFLSTNALG
jgi:hypothetical protein